jgi:hypothetical protein
MNITRYDVAFAAIIIISPQIASYLAGQFTYFAASIWAIASGLACSACYLLGFQEAKQGAIKKLQEFKNHHVPL